MLRTNVYLTEEQERAIRARASVTQKPRAEILREIINKGLKADPVQKSASTELFTRLADVAEKFRGKGKAPNDLSRNLDKYTWDE